MPPPTSGPVAVQGLAELHRAFRVASREVAKDVQEAIKQAGEPIRQDASNRVRANVSGMARVHLPWWRMRLGIERQTIGYIVPEQKGVRTKGGSHRRRPNLAPLIVAEELAARDAQIHRVQAEFTDALNEVARVWARV